MQNLVYFKRKVPCCLQQDIEHDGRDIPNPRDPPEQSCTYIPPGKNISFSTCYVSWIT